ncbi:Wzz/FepE/Etk N-terminal domain-containing protein [Flavitalea sp.]|nr:Wzz/FepE/Etk N-terminal domain-containing protein [Flavitalea sp.]
MSIYPEHNSSNNDEIDLLKFVEKIVRFFRTNLKFILGGILIGLLAGILYYYITPKKYTATMIVQSTVLTNAEQIEVLKNWNDLVKRNELEILARFLNTNTGIISKLRLIEGIEILKLYVENNSIGFRINVLVSDTTILDTLQRSIIYGLENGEYIKSRVDARTQDLHKLIREVQSQIAQLDSTKKLVERQFSLQGKSGSSVIVNLSDMNTQTVALNEKLLKYEEELKFISPLKVLQNFIKYKKPFEPKLVKCVVLGLVCGFIVGYLLAFFNLISVRLSRNK